MMDEQILGAEEDFQMSMETVTSDPKERYFNEVVMMLQQVILDQEFQSAQTLFMRQNCDHDIKSQSEILKLFNIYRDSISQLLHKKISAKIPNFDFKNFAEELSSRKDKVDQQIAEIVLSCVDVQSFKNMLNDYKTAQQQQQRYRVLTVKTNKLPQNKKVKGNNQNIFGSSNACSFEKKGAPKKTASKASEKNIDQILVPETVLTVKGFRKS